MDATKNKKSTVLAPSGRVSFPESETLKSQLLSVIKEGYLEVIVDFTDVKSIDSSGLGKLLMAHKKLSDKGGKLRIINIENDYVKQMFEMTKLNLIIDIDGL